MPKNKLSEWTKTKGLKFSREKTVVIKFETRKRGEEPQLSLYNSNIQVRESTSYLGLIVDKRLSWRQHVESLRTKCIPAVNLLKHLSHLSWGADRTTLKLLYTALVQSKLDYGAQIYGKFRANVLQRLNPIQNECLRACTGAFRSSPAVSLCTEAGVLPLEFSRDAICLKYFFKAHAHPNSLTHQAIVGKVEEDPSPGMEHIQSLLTEYRLTVPKILPSKIAADPPWIYPSAQICPFIGTRKNNHTDVEMRSEFLAHLGEHTTEHVYTDGSKSNQHVGFAARFKDTISSGRLPGDASIFTAEMHAIKITLSNILNMNSENRRYTIFSDSQGVLLALRPDAGASPIAEDIRASLNYAKAKNISIDFCWVPGHVGIKGNEEADTAAKEASANENYQFLDTAIPHTDMKRPVREAITKAWRNKWLSLGQKGRKLREIKTDVNEWSSSYNKNRRIETVLARLRIGHSNLTHSYLMQGHADPLECDRCRQPTTVKHILLECRKFAPIRNK